MKVLVFGATGFIGHSVCLEFLRRGWDVLPVIRQGANREIFLVSNLLPLQINPSNFEAGISDVIRENQPDCVINALGLWNEHEYSNDIRVLMSVNVELPALIAVACQETKSKFVQLSSYWQFEHSRLWSNKNSYTYSKIAAYHFIEALRKYESQKVENIVLYDNYGQNDKRDKLLPKLIERVRTGQTLTLSNPYRLLNLLHVEDVARGIYQSVVSDSDGPLEVSAPHLLSIGELTNLISSAFGAEIRVVWRSTDGSLPQDISHKKIFPWPTGWSPNHTLQQDLLMWSKLQ